MAGGDLKRKMIDAIRDLRDRVEALEESPYTLCEAAPLERPPCVAIGPRGGCLVTPWHAVHAWHYRLTPGDVVTYEWGQRTVVGVAQVGGTDIAIATMDAEADCEPARLLPWDWAVSLRTDRHGEHLRRPIRCLGTRADGTVHEATLRVIGEDWAAPGPWSRGDSGQPVWLPMPEPVLLGCHLYSGYGPAVHHWWREISRVTAELGVVPEEAVWNQ